MMGLDDVAISLALSYLAGNIPTIKDKLSKKGNLEERIEQCYQNALKQWRKNDSIRKNMSIHVFENTKKLAKYIETGSAVIINELINFWGKELRNDKLCYAFLLECKLDGILDIAHNQASTLGEINSKIDILLDTSREGSPIRKGLTKHKPVNNYIRRYCSSETDHHESLYYLLRNAERNTLADYVTGVVSHDTNKFILYSGGQTGKTTELRNLCWELQNSGLYIPVSFEVKSSYDLKRDDLPQTRFYNNKEIVIIIDALDEINGKTRDELLLTICSFAHDNPDIKMILSCRGNYRREDIMDEFSALYLMDMSDNDAQEHINNSLGENNLGKLIYDCGLSEFTKQPFTLNVLIEAYRVHSELPRTRADVYKLFIEQSYITETGKPTFKFFESDKNTAIVTLERVALALSLMGKQSLTQNELEKCLGYETKIQECLRYSIIKFKDGMYSFEHNAFREWLVAFYLYKNGVEKARTFATQPNGRIKPEWHNIVVLWISMYSYQDQNKIDQIIDWLKIASLELLIYADRDTLEETKKDSIFKGILLEYKSLGIRMSSLFSDEYKKMIDFGQSKNTIRFITDELNEAKFGTAYYSDLICLCRYLDWIILEKFHKPLFDDLLLVLENNVRNALKQESSDGDLTYVYLENEFFMEKPYMDRFFTIIKDSNNYEAIKAMLGLIYRAKAGNDYIDYILEKEIYVRNQQKGCTTYVVSRDSVYLSLYSVDSEEGILKVLKHDFRDPYYYHSDWSKYTRLIQNMLLKASKFIKNGNQELVVAVENTFITLFGDRYRHYGSDLDASNLLLCYRDCYKKSDLVNIAKTEFDYNITSRILRLSNIEKIDNLIAKTGLWLTSEMLDEYYSNFNPASSENKQFASLLNQCTFSDVAAIAQNKFDEFFPKDEPSKYQLRRERLFYDFKDYPTFKQQVLESLGKITTSDVREVRKLLRENADEIVNDYIFRFIISYIDNNATFSQETIIRAIKNKECYDDFFMKIVADALSYGTTYEPIDSDCKTRCFVTAKKIVIALSNGFYNGHYGDDALQLMLHGHFNVTKEELIKLLPYSNVSITKKEAGNFSKSYSLFDYISENVPTQKLADSVITMLKQNEAIGNSQLCNRLATYIIDNRVVKGYPVLLRYVVSDNISALNIAIMMIKANIMVAQIKIASDNMSESDKLEIYHYLLTEQAQDIWVKDKLESQYTNFEECNKKFALCILVSLGSMTALSYLTSNPEFLIEDRSYNFRYIDVNAVGMLTFILQYYYDNKMNDVFINKSIIDSLEQIAIQNEVNLNEVKKTLRAIIAKYDYFSYLNKYIIMFENKFYEYNTDIKDIDYALKLIDTTVSSYMITKNSETVCEPIYISYNWESKSTHIVDYFCFVLDTLNIENRRDKKDCHYMDNIKEFMNAIHKGHHIVVVLSRPYLQSKNCMYELTGIMQNGNYKDRIIPVVTDDSIRDPYFFIDLVKYWKDQKAEKQDIVEKMRNVDENFVEPLDIELKEVDRIYNFLVEIKNYIDWTNAESLDSLCSTRFKSIIDIVVRKNKLQY